MPLPKPPSKPATLLKQFPSTPSAAEAGPPAEARQARTAEPTPPPPAARLALVDSKARNGRKARPAGPARLFVLDTNVLMHDPTSLFRFEEHDVFLPMMTLEELDGHKKGMSEVARNARQVSRSLDALIAVCKNPIEDGIPLSGLGSADATGRLFFQTTAAAGPLPSTLPAGKADNQILGVVRTLQDMHPGRDVVLVSKDINMRVKARALGLPTEDYTSDKVLEDSDILYTGAMALPNQFVYLEGDTPFLAQVKEIRGKTAVLRVLRDYMHAKNAVWGITARNREQCFALNLLMDPECDFVTLIGQAGTGKTLLALAAGLAQTLETKRYAEIIVTRATVPVGEDIGFLPGTEEEKMAPWMGALEDNLEVLTRGDDAAGEWGRAATIDLIRSRIRIKSMNFMRGRTFLNKYLIMDECQNLTPKQMKTLITRAGPGTKVVCLGNIAQIDTPYLTEGSSGLTFVVDRFKGWQHSGHVTLQRGERSRLADHAADVL
jgi:PhoH-like ATPase